ncbi:MAG: S1 RNA-binding domain-containing protein [Planctomycetota bacterium]|jgi:uncharacterized protein
MAETSPTPTPEDKEAPPVPPDADATPTQEEPSPTSTDAEPEGPAVPPDEDATPTQEEPSPTSTDAEPEGPPSAPAESVAPTEAPAPEVAAAKSPDAGGETLPLETPPPPPAGEATPEDRSEAGPAATERGSGAATAPPSTEATASSPTETAVAGTVAARTAPAVKKKARPPRRVPPRAQRKPLTAEQKLEARTKAREVILAQSTRDPKYTSVALDLIDSGVNLVFAGRYRRVQTNGLDERMLRSLRDAYRDALHVEERRVQLREVLREHAALDAATEKRLARAVTVHAMEDLAAPHLPVTAGRATVARGLGLQDLADAIRTAPEGSVLSDLAKAYVKEDAEPKSLDEALAGARDILAEEMSLDVNLRARLRKLFHKQAVLSVALRTERKGDAGRHRSLVGYQAPATKVPPLKFLGIRRAEKERVLICTIEPPEDVALSIVRDAAAREGHPHEGMLRAAAEDGYRRILKPLFQAEMREELKARADRQAMETFERNLRNLLLGPIGGRVRTLGIRADVAGGHRWCTVDAVGLPTGSGQLPHEPTAGREACLTELKEILKTYEVESIAVGSGAGRGEAMSLAREAVEGHEPPIEVVKVADGGTRLLEGLEKLSFDDRPDVLPESRGALSLARRFQDPLSELIHIDPKALALGPHLHDVHQGRLRDLLDETVRSCVARVGPNPATAGEDMLARLPGMNRARAEAFTTWQKEHGPLRVKAALAAVEGVGTDAAALAVGFLRIPDAEDPRDRTQLHPEEYGIVDRMAEQLGKSVPELFADHSLLGKVRLKELVTDETPIPLLRNVLAEIAEGHLEIRLRHAAPIPPPPGMSLETLRPGLVLEGRVVRSLPFGVFVDVGLRTEALIPTAHIGVHPGADPAAVAPVGAVIQARVLDVEPEKKRLTLTMREGPVERHARGDRRGPRGPRGPRTGERGEREGRPARRREGADAGRPAGAGRASGGRPGGGRPTGKPRGKPQRKAGKYDGGTIGDIFRGRGRREDRGVPRSISLGPDDGEKSKPKDADDEKDLTPEELLAKKLADLKKKFGDKK